MIPVFILPDGGNADVVSYLFSNSLFEVIKIDKELSEKTAIMTALNLWKTLHPESNAILIKDTSMSSFDPEQIAIYCDQPFGDDLLYLCRWNDGCNLYRDERNVEGNVMVTTYRPHGFQAILFKPKVRDAILSDSFESSGNIGDILTSMIYSNKLKAKTYLINVVEYDILNYGYDNIDYTKFNRCADPLPPPRKSIPASTYFYVGAIIALVIIAGIGMFKLGPATKTKKSTEQAKVTPEKQDNNKKLNDNIE